MALPSFIPAWSIVVMGMLLIVIILIKWSNSINVLSFIKQNFFYLFLLLILAVLVISIFNITTNNEFDFSTLEGVRGAVKVYLNWFASLGRNVVEITGYAINQDWVAQGNSTGGKS